MKRKEKVKDKKIKEKKHMAKEKKSMLLKTGLLVVVAAIVCFLIVPLFKSLNFGLDLQGGFEILYEVSPIDGSKMTKDKLNATYKSMLKRIDTLGVSEPEITLEGNDKIRVKLAGVTNKDEARETLSTVATLTFRDSEDNLLMSSDVLEAGGARLTTDANGRPAVSLAVKDKDTFYKVTNAVKDYENNIIAIWLDYNEMTDSYASEGSMCGTSESNCISSATVSEGFASDVIIQGNFTEEEASNLVDLINSGSLPAKLTEISSKTVGASFGDATLTMTMYAGIAGILAIIILLIGIYNFAGIISAVSILLYTLFVFAAFWLIGGVLTLPGIAALILGIGMAVDANVLTYSRIKEELLKGRSLETAFKNGSKASFGTILDANLTTLLVAIIMFYLGESSVKGFATMLIINIIVTMVTMVFITRILMKMFVKTKYFDNKLNLFIGVHEENINKTDKKPTYNYLGLSKFFAAFSLVVILASVVMFAFKGMNLGIDFQAGSDITLATTEVSEKDLRSDLKELKLDEVSIDITSSETDIRVSDELKEDEINKVESYFLDKYNASVDIGVVSNVVKQDLIKNAIFSIVISLIGIILYITFRFKFSYGISSVICLVHDALMMVASVILLRVEVNSMFIAAVLAIIGYSINNTIVVFDRVRENLRKKDKENLNKEELKDVVNISIKETMARSIYTSLTTLLPVIALLVMGSREILTFNVAMIVGLIAGTYSSLLLAGWLYVFFASKKKNNNKKKKVVKEVSEKTIKGIND
ncbi:MAG TPA: protein translocase subunit SecD [Candidatus Onthousia excrementipullorum]|uniref:Multifunctional fusion protein n=1 Tax=Candidatus Onthousia excrementipullorum TaxID=2840884 RepID=A0A9D1J3N9_9FIRM|nr:protein translocase subunit SecD [Candidatus Onthousia excrementipullorum]